MTLVRGLRAAAIATGLMLRVSGSTSTSTGVAPTWWMTPTVAENVRGVVMTSSPGPTPRVARAVCRAAVQELTPRAAGAPTRAANSDSNRWDLGPVVIQPDRRVSTTSEISSSPIDGGEKARKLLRANPGLQKIAFSAAAESDGGDVASAGSDRIVPKTPTLDQTKKANPCC